MNQLLHFWTVDLGSLLVVASLGALYGFLANWRLRPGAGLYGAGLLLIGLVQASPLHFLGMYYLLSAHMVGHMVLLLICAPLLVLGLPKKTVASANGPMTTLSVFFQQRPWFGWLIGVLTMWFWHIPPVYNATVSHTLAYGSIAAIPLCTLSGTSASSLVNGLHLVQPVSLLLAGICFAWPVLGPRRAYRIHPLSGAGYLFTACVGCSLLGLLITFAPVGQYFVYGGPDYYGIDYLLRQNWGLDRATDQQTAGLLMWVPGCFIYLTGVVYLLTNWLIETNVSPAIQSAGGVRKEGASIYAHTN